MFEIVSERERTNGDLERFGYFSVAAADLQNEVPPLL